MNRTIQVWRKQEHHHSAVYEGIDVGSEADLQYVPPSYYASRIWAGVVPPEEDGPGYVAVLIEVLDSDPRPRERLVRLVDEATALDPLDFTTRERRLFDIPENNLAYPTKRRLAQAVVALKDLYAVQRIFVPPGRGTNRGDVRPTPFTDFIRRQDGLTQYDNNLTAVEFKRWYPFFKNTSRVAEGIVEVAYEDAIYNRRLIDSRYESQTLQVDIQHCPLFDHGKFDCARRCVGMVLYEMEQDEMLYEIRSTQYGDGYVDSSRDTEVLGALAKREQERRNAMLWFAGTPIHGGP